jgi:small subunit ribosomal protein S19e
MKYMESVDKTELVNKSATELKKIKEINPPEWSSFVRTGADKERPPVSKDWWYIRAASIMVKTARLGPVGVAKLRTQYGGKKRRGHKPAEFRKSSGSIVRKIMQQLEKAGLLRQHEKGIHKGRVLTPQGTSFLNKIAKGMSKDARPKRAAKTAGASSGARAKPKAEPKQGVDSKVRKHQVSKPKPGA